MKGHASYIYIIKVLRVEMGNKTNQLGQGQSELLRAAVELAQRRAEARRVEEARRAEEERRAEEARRVEKERRAAARRAVLAARRAKAARRAADFEDSANVERRAALRRKRALPGPGTNIILMYDDHGDADERYDRY